MKIIKKKDLKKYKTNTDKDELDELVDVDGTMVGDKKGSSRGTSNDTEIEVPNQQTSDDFANKAIQPHRYYYGIGGTAYSHGDIRAESDEEENSEVEIAEAKMRDMLETLLDDKKNVSGVVKKNNPTDVNRNGIPDIEDLSDKYKKPIVVKKVKDVLNTIQMNGLNGEEVGIVVNHILNNVDLGKIPNDYKTLLKKNI